MTSLAARRSDGTILAGTHGRGVFSGTLPATGVEEQVIPVEAALLPNYPTPLNPVRQSGSGFPRRVR